MKSKSYNSLRWILLAAGIIAILGITGMNVYSLYKLRDSAIEADKNNLKLQINQYADRLRYQFYRPFMPIGRMDMDNLQNTWRATGEFPDDFIKLMDKAAESSTYSKLYEGIYFQEEASYACLNGDPIQKYDPEQRRFVQTTEYPPEVCDGIAITRTRMNALVGNYQRYNNKIIFDSHRSMTTALVDVTDHAVIGYLVTPIDRDYLVNEFLPNTLREEFGSPGNRNTGIVAWVRDWTTGTTLARSDSTANYSRESLVYYDQRFPNMFDEWEVAGVLNKNSIVAASNASLVKNLVVLGAALLLLIGAFGFMFITAQRERALAQRQAGFLANVTHELKTPLAVMQAAGENLADGRVKDPKRLKSYGNHIYSESVRLRGMIEKLLDVAKADAGQSIIEAQPVYMNQLVRAWISDHESYIEKQGFTLETSIPDKMPMAMVDPDSIETILGNLVENSIKYSGDTRFIRISLDSEGRTIVLKVEDRGLGIPKHSIKHIFDKFYRVEETLTAETKGHGLGLSIVQNLVDLNGGTVDVESAEGGGATFTVTFPVLLESDSGARSPDRPTSPVEPSPLTQDSPNYVG